MPVTPVKIRTLQRKLYAKAKQEPGYRFYALYDKVYRADPLQHAYRRVKSNKGAPGSNGVNFADIEAEEGVEQVSCRVDRGRKVGVLQLPATAPWKRERMP